MKKIMAFVLSAAMALSMAACGNTASSSQQETSSAASGSQAVAALGTVEVLEKIYAALPEDQKFPIGGGDSANMVMDKPGKFDIANVEELDAALALPAAEAAHIDSAASMMHGMMANNFTSAAYHLKDTTVDAFAAAVKENVMTRQWMCGAPETFLVIDAGSNTVFTAFGAADIIEAVRTAALSAIDGAKIVMEESIVENF